jgi:hypothetical protein
MVGYVTMQIDCCRGTGVRVLIAVITPVCMTQLVNYAVQASSDRVQVSLNLIYGITQRNVT